VVAGNGLKAMEVLLIARVLPELIFLDINMPGIGGYDFLHALRTNAMYAAYKDIPVVVLTGSIRDEEKFHALGAHVCITKPFSGKLYSAIIRTVLENDVVKETARVRQLIAQQLKG
jgi:CheY-like chemotaxis protein